MGMMSKEKRFGPKQYYQGLSKKDAEKRERALKKKAKMDPEDPDVYEPLPGDEKVKTKPSAYTKKFHKLFNESKVMSFDEFIQKGVSVKEEEFDRTGFYYEYYRNLTPENFDVQVEGNMIKIQVPPRSSDSDIMESKKTQETNKGPINNSKIETALKNKLKEIKEKDPQKYKNVTLGILRAVMRRGMGAWGSGGHRPGANQEQWGYARVNSFLTGGKTIGTSAKPGPDGDLGKQARLIDDSDTEK
jgi:hypothetical protein